MVDSISSKEDLKSFLFKRISRKHELYNNNNILNINRLNSLMTGTCGEYCLFDLKSKITNENENLCLNQCANNFYEAIKIGEEIFNGLQ